MFTEEERAKLRQLVARWKAGEKVFDAGKRVEKTDVTTVQRQEPAQPIKRNFIAEAQRKHAAEAVGPDTRSSYQRKQALAAKLYANRQYQKAKDDAKRAEGMELLMKTMSPSTYVEAATGLDLGTVGRLITDAAAFGSPSLIKQGFNFASKQYGKYAVRNMLKRSIQKTSTPNIIDMGKMSKWTPEQWTAAQDAAIARGDMAEAQRLRDLHFKAKTPNNKITSKLYHGTDAMWTEYNPGFFSSGSGDQGVFGKGLYLSQYPEVSKPYGKNMMELYAYSKNPYTADRGFELFDDAAYAFNRYENSEELFPVLKGKDAVTSPRIVMEDGWKFHYEPNEEVVIPRGEQIKSADAVTYDNKGVRIPLGKRDNFSIADIRYGIIPPIIGYSLYNKYGLPEIFVTPRGNRVIAPRRSIFEDGGF